MAENEVFDKLSDIDNSLQQLNIMSDSPYATQIEAHKVWLQSIRHERPNPEAPFKVGIYIRYFNQTKYSNYLSYHKKAFADTLALCPNWELVDFYIDEGATAPNMESASEWSRLLLDAMAGKVNLIITQKVSNVSRKMQEVTICARLLAAQNPPIGIYFISEDIFTLASYYREDMKDIDFLPSPDWQLLEEGGEIS